MSQNNEKAEMLKVVAKINEVEGFDPNAFAVDYVDGTTGEVIKRLPVIAQIAWFRLKYPTGRIAVDVKPRNGFFEAKARVYAECTHPDNCFLAEATASRGYVEDKPSISPREWAQTAAIGVALRNAGFGLQFRIAGDDFAEIAPDEFAGKNESMEAEPFLQPFFQPQEQMGMMPQPIMQQSMMPQPMMPQNTMPQPIMQQPVMPQNMGYQPMMPQQMVPQPMMVQPTVQGQEMFPQEMLQDTYNPMGMGGSQQMQPEPKKELTFEQKLDLAMKVECPIKKFQGKTLGDLITLDPGALSWIANKSDSNEKIKEAARIICEYALQQTAG